MLTVMLSRPPPPQARSSRDLTSKWWADAVLQSIRSLIQASICCRIHRPRCCFSKRRRRGSDPTRSRCSAHLSRQGRVNSQGRDFRPIRQQRQALSGRPRKERMRGRAQPVAAVGVGGRRAQHSSGGAGWQALHHRQVCLTASSACSCHGLTGTEGTY